MGAKLNTAYQTLKAAHKAYGGKGKPKTRAEIKAAGEAKKPIAEELGVSVRTVQRRMVNIQVVYHDVCPGQELIGLHL